MNYKLTLEQEIKFNKLVQNMQQEIFLALYKCNIPKKLYDDFYSYALEGLLISFLILENGDISEKDFEKFSFTTMKRKVIDELRRRNKEKYVYFEEIENFQVFKNKENKIEHFIIIESLKKELTAVELEIFNMLNKGDDVKIIFKKLNISKSKGYALIKVIKDKYLFLMHN